MSQQGAQQMTIAGKVKLILEQHKAIRHLRGGQATKEKWAKKKTEQLDVNK